MNGWPDEGGKDGRGVSKKIIPVGYHVVVTPDRKQWMTAEHIKDLCDAMPEQIRRHVDGVGTVEVVVETESVCSSCGRPWLEESDTFNAGCCAEDLQNDPCYGCAQYGHCQQDYNKTDDCKQEVD